jgi:dTDP-4-amino-4,6-dideoxygalactose transaminase
MFCRAWPDSGKNRRRPLLGDSVFMEKLALFGGPKAVTLDYEKLGNRPLVNSAGMKDAAALMERGEISSSKSVYQFEERFARYTGARYALACCNGTSALHSALFGVGIGPGDEVLVPSFTFWATIGPVYWCGAVPVFCDVDAKTHCMDPADMEKRITARTKAVMPVHVWGNLCDMDAVMQIAQSHNLKVVEDCSHAHGSKYKGRHVGTIGDIGCYSLQGTKMLPAGEGGVLVTNNRGYFEKSMSLGQYDRLSRLEEDSPYRKYKLTGMGLKYRPHPLGIALANSALDELDERNAIRNANGRGLEKYLADLDFINSPLVPEGCERQFSYQYMTYNPSKFGGVRTFTLLKALSAEGVMCGYCGYGQLHLSPLVLEGGPFKPCAKDPLEPVKLPVTEYLAVNVFLAAPRFENDCPDLIEQYSKAYHKAAFFKDELREYDRDKDYSVELGGLSGRTIDRVK